MVPKSDARMRQYAGVGTAARSVNARKPYGPPSLIEFGDLTNLTRAKGNRSSEVGKSKSSQKA